MNESFRKICHIKIHIKLINHDVCSHCSTYILYVLALVAKKAGWIDSKKQQRVDHIGFGVVQGDDGKRFKTRSSETVRYVNAMINT